MANVSDLNVKMGDEVVIIGKQGEAAITADDVAIGGDDQLRCDKWDHGEVPGCMCDYRVTTIARRPFISHA